MPIRWAISCHPCGPAISSAVLAASASASALNIALTNDDGWSRVLWNDEAVLSKNYSVAGYDRTHIFQLGFVAELPFGREGTGVLDAVVKDWVVNGVVTGVSGRPLTVIASGASWASTCKRR